MKWQGRRGSQNIEDRRRSGSTGGAAGVGGVGLIAIVLIGYFLGIDVTPYLEGTGQGAPTSGNVTLTEADEQAAQFVSVTLADTEEVWTDIFSTQLNQTYHPPTLVLFKGSTNSACGGANAQTGPFYCPTDGKVYLDTDFFTMLEQQLGAGGDFAAAYVVAHEIGHHVQDELGILEQANRVRAQASEAQSNAISVQIELQADCLAGVWANAARQRFASIEKGDSQEAMNAAARIGDDTLQRDAGQTVRPDSFTHGTSEQRQRWFMQGYQSGDIEQCDTFNGQPL